MPWSARIVFCSVLLGLGALGGTWAYEHGRGLAGLPPRPDPADMAVLQARVAELQRERDRLSAAANASESQLAVERAAQRKLGDQVRVLEVENSRLKEDLAFFERLLPVNTRAAGVTIRGIAAETIQPGSVHYRLLVMQGSKGGASFEGNLRLSVTAVQNGRTVLLNFPDGKSAEINSFRLGFRHYQRLEGTLPLPPGAVARSLQATVLEKGQVRAQQSVNL